jgi:hypothetical protein
MVKERGDLDVILLYIAINLDTRVGYEVNQYYQPGYKVESDSHFTQDLDWPSLTAERSRVSERLTCR